MVQRMPVARRKDGDARLSCCSDPTVQHGHYLITMFDRQGAAGTEVDLNVHEDQPVTGSEYISRNGHLVEIAHPL
jgi:hypothetical protein